MIPGLITLIAVAGLALLTYAVSSHADTASIDAEVTSGHYPQAPNYRTELPLLGSNRTTSLAAFRGRIVVVNVFASWCPPCQSEAPILAREQKVLARHGGTFVGVAYENAASDAEAFARRYGLHFPVLRDTSGNYVQGFGTYQLPETFVLSRQGRILAVSRDAVSAGWLKRTLTPILAGRVPAQA